MRRTTVAALLAAALLVPASVAYATPEGDAAELSDTIETAWLMPGTFTGYAAFPQTYLPNGVPECGEGTVQLHLYRYGTPEVRSLVDALLAGGVLSSRSADVRISANRALSFVELEPCSTDGPADPVDQPYPPDPTDEPTDPGYPTDEPTDPSTPTETPIDPGQVPVEVLPAATSASAVVAAPTFTG